MVMTLHASSEHKRSLIVALAVDRTVFNEPLDNVVAQVKKRWLPVLEGPSAIAKNSFGIGTVTKPAMLRHTHPISLLNPIFIGYVLR